MAERRRVRANVLLLPSAELNIAKLWALTGLREELTMSCALTLGLRQMVAAAEAGDEAERRVWAETLMASWDNLARQVGADLRAAREASLK